jgi:EAL domain-containing protein (putative c-di-GMP-specific phosphodiesterase class I)
VETEQQHAFLRTTGCNEMQGFLFSAAVPEAEIFNLMGSNRQLRAA